MRLRSGRALGDDDDREVAGRASGGGGSAEHLLDVERALEDQDHIGAAGQPGVQGDPAGGRPITSTVMRFDVVVGGGRWRRWRSPRCRANVVVRPAESLSIVFGTPITGRPCAPCSSAAAPSVVLAADHDQAVEVERREVLADALGVLMLEGFVRRRAGWCRRAALDPARRLDRSSS